MLLLASDRCPFGRDVDNFGKAALLEARKKMFHGKKRALVFRKCSAHQPFLMDTYHSHDLVLVYQSFGAGFQPTRGLHSYACTVDQDIQRFCIAIRSCGVRNTTLIEVVKVEDGGPSRLKLYVCQRCALNLESILLTSWNEGSDRVCCRTVACTL